MWRSRLDRESVEERGTAKNNFEPNCFSLHNTTCNTARQTKVVLRQAISLSLSLSLSLSPPPPLSLSLPLRQSTRTCPEVSIFLIFLFFISRQKLKSMRAGRETQIKNVIS